MFDSEENFKHRVEQGLETTRGCPTCGGFRKPRRIVSDENGVIYCENPWHGTAGARSGDPK